MSPEKQRIAIAEVCGWERWKSSRDSSDVRLTKPTETQRQYWLNCGNVTTTEPVTLRLACPDYLRDLNAMHEAEKMLQGEREWEAYIQNLLKLTRGKGFVVLHATAAQRAEAFLKAIKKWEDS